MDRSNAWIAAMRAGQFEAAWALSRQVLAERDPATRNDPSSPPHLRWVWDGSDVAHRHVLVRCYHGLGDTLQFARFLPILAGRAASVTVEVQPRLHDLLAGSIEGVRFVAADLARAHPPGECELEIGELDFALRAPPGATPPPYLRWPRAVLPPGSVGLCYTAGDWDHQRRLAPAQLTPLCRHAPCITLVAEPTTLAVANPEGCPFDMRATASLVAGCDLVITVDTMIAHLAGALGRPTWLLLKAEPDWRWPPDQRTSAWYPSMRFYVQPHPGDWTPVIAQVERDLATRTLAAMER